MAKITFWEGTDAADYYSNSSSSDVTLMSSHAGDDTVINAKGGARIDAGTDNNFVSLAATGSNTVMAGGGNDTVNVATASYSRYKNFISISGGDNYINNSNILQSTIKAGAGNDTIITGGYFALINAGNGTNRITVTTADGNNSITAGTGKDYISITGSSGNNYIDAGKGNNTVYGGLGNNNTVLSGTGNHRVTIGGGLVSLGNGSMGSKISLDSYGGASVISGNGNDTLDVAKSSYSRYKNFISMGDGNNLINNSNIMQSTISAGKGNDIITSGGYFALIDAGAGNNRISLTTADGNNTVTTGDGNSLISITGASGNNVIRVGNGKNTVKGGTGNGTSVTAGDGDSFVTIGGGLVSLGNAVTGSKISLSSYGGASVISGAGNDTLNVSASEYARYYNFIDMGGGNNRINNSNILQSTIKAGAGSDIITTGGYYASISAGNGNNQITVTTADGSNTITTGDGNSLISITGASGNNYINVGRGNNTVYGGLGGSNTVLGGAGNSRVTIGGGLVTLGSGNGNEVSLDGNYGGSSVKSGTGNDTINVSASEYARYYNFISVSGGDNLINNSNILHSTIKAGAGNDTITSGGYYASILAGGGNNRISLTTADGNNTVTAGAGNDLISITGASGNNFIDAGDGDNTVKSGSGNGSTIFAGDGNNKITIGGGLVTLGNGKGNRVSLSSYGGASVISGSGNDTVIVAKSSYSRYYNFIDAGEGNNSINNSNILHSTIKAGAGNDVITTGGYFASIDAGDGNNQITVADTNGNNTLVAGTGNDTYTGSNGYDLFVYKGGNDVITNCARDDIISLAGSGASDITDISGITFDSLGSAALVFMNNPNNTLILQNAVGFSFAINGSTRILADNAFYSTDQQSVTLTADYTGDIDASKFTNFSAAALGWPVALLGNVLSNNLAGGSGNDSLYGVAGNDTLSGGAGDDILTGGAGNDLFIYTAGNDVVTDMENRDTLQIGNGTGTYSTAVRDADIVVTAGNGSVILTGAATLDTLNIVGSKTLILTNTNGATTLEADIKVADASARTKAIKIVGNALDNSIIGGNGNDYLYGKDGDDSLWGGAGNDSLWGGDGADIFIYKANTGTDTIADYTNADMLQILKADGSAGGSFTNSAFGSGKLTLTIDGGGSVVFKGVKTSTTFNINDDAYAISGNALVKK